MGISWWHVSSPRLIRLYAITQSENETGWGETHGIGEITRLHSYGLLSRSRSSEVVKQQWGVGNNTRAAWVKKQCNMGHSWRSSNFRECFKKRNTSLLTLCLGSIKENMVLNWVILLKRSYPLRLIRLKLKRQQRWPTCDTQNSLTWYRRFFRQLCLHWLIANY